MGEVEEMVDGVADGLLSVGPFFSVGASSGA